MAQIMTQSNSLESICKEDSKKQAALYIFSGLPATGKTTLAQKLATYIQGVFIRIDTIEQGLRDFCDLDVYGEGYQLAYRIAQDNLRLRIDVIADSCNPISLTRQQWESIAKDSGTNFHNIEVICSDCAVHRARVETRLSTVPNLKLPCWEDVLKREYHDWQSEHHVIDTAGPTVEDSFRELLQKLGLLGTVDEYRHQ